MENFDQDHHLHGESKSDGVQHAHRAYWKRAHQDWRAWVAVVFIILAMSIYVMSDDFAFLSRSRQQTPPSGAAGK